MSSVARWYIALVVASGTVILLLAARWWSSASLTQFAALLCFTLFASTLKVRIPGMTSTISPNFAFLLIAIAFFSFSQVIVATAGAALMQSFWRPKSRPQMVQVLFSAAALVGPYGATTDKTGVSTLLRMGLPVFCVRNCRNRTD